MRSKIEDKKRIETFLNFYFDLSKGYEIAGVKRAYLDFNRTLKIQDRENHSTKKSKMEEWVITTLNSEILNIELKNQQEFNKIHEKLIKSLIQEWNILSIGHAQKWINMTLKYWFLFGEGHINGISKNAKYFHVPIDSYVLKGMLGIKAPKPWSKISNYSEYLDHQEKIQNDSKKENAIPLIFEIDFFNKYKNEGNNK